MPLSDPYAPPKSAVGPIEPEVSGQRRLPFPWALVLAWLVGGAITLHALFGAYSLLTAWGQMSDLAVIEKAMNPLPYLLVVLAKLATGVLILLRRWWLFGTMTLWFGGYLYMLFVRGNTSLSSAIGALALAELLAVLGFCVCLGLFRRLR